MTTTNAPYARPAPAHLPVDFVTDGFYADNDPTHSIIDPIKQKAYEYSEVSFTRVGDLKSNVALYLEYGARQSSPPRFLKVEGHSTHARPSGSIT
jgi:hypothetical protein